MGPDDQIQGGQSSCQMPERFTNLPPYPVAIDRPRKQALGHDHTQSCMALPVGPSHNLKDAGAHRATIRHYGFKLCRPQQALAAGKRVSRGQAENLYRQAMTALGATRIDDSAAAAGLHADEKAVGTLTAGNGRLIGTFHVCCLFTVNGQKSPEKTAY